MENNKKRNSNKEIENRIYQYNNNSNDRTKTNGDGNNNFEYSYVIYITSFLAFFINYPINREITKYRKKYIAKELDNIYISKEEAYMNIYSKDRKLFLFTVFIPYCGEIIISLIIYGIFNAIIFTKNEIVPNENIDKENIQTYNENKSEIKIKEVSFKKILGYTIFNQTIIEKEEKLSFLDNFCDCFKLLFKSIGECFKSSFCLICMKCPQKCSYCYECNCNECDCSLCKYCKDCCPCCFRQSNFEQREMKICICYQEKRKIKWFKDFINNKKQKFLVQLVFLIAYFRSFSIGNEVLYKETNENKTNQENIMLPLIVAFLTYTILTTISGNYFLKYSKNNSFQFFKYEIQEIYKDLSMSILFGSIIAFTINGIYSFITSILYFTNRKFFDKDKDMHVSVYINKFAIFILTYFCQTQDEENELISNSSLIAIYLYIIDLISSLIKAIFSIKVLMIFQIIFPFPVVLLYLYFILYSYCFSSMKCNS